MTKHHLHRPPRHGLYALHKRGENAQVRTVEAAVIGVGWIGGLRADTLSRTALVEKLHLCDIKPDRLAEVTRLYKPASSTLDYQDIIKNDAISRGLHVDHAGSQPLSDCARLPERRQERDAGKADRARIVGSRRADPARQAQQSEIHHRLFAALQSQNRLRQEEDHRRHARQCRLGAGQPPSVARAWARRSPAACGCRRW